MTGWQHCVSRCTFPTRITFKRSVLDKQCLDLSQEKINRTIKEACSCFTFQSPSFFVKMYSFTVFTFFLFVTRKAFCVQVNCTNLTRCTFQTRTFKYAKCSVQFYLSRFITLSLFSEILTNIFNAKYVTEQRGQKFAPSFSLYFREVTIVLLQRGNYFWYEQSVGFPTQKGVEDGS